MSNPPITKEEEIERIEEIVELIRRGRNVMNTNHSPADENNYSREQGVEAITALLRDTEREAAHNEALIADMNLGKFPDYNAMKEASLTVIDNIEKGLYISPSELSPKPVEEDK